MTILLSAQGVTKAFGPRPLFADLSLDLRAGERIGLFGPNDARPNRRRRTRGNDAVLEEECPSSG
jgi:ABC-type lipopolysaccharide export system ATPase subunit